MKHKGSSFIIIIIFVALMVSVSGFVLTKTHSNNFNHMTHTFNIYQARLYSLDLVNIIRATKYSSIVEGQGQKVRIDNSDFYKKVDVKKVPISPNEENKTINIFIYYKNEIDPCAAETLILRKEI